MKTLNKLMALLSLMAMAAISICQTPSYLQIVGTKGRAAEAIWEVDQAKALGYEGICVNPGTSSIADPALTAWQTDWKAVLAEAHKCGLKLHIRLLPDVPILAYSNGKPTGGFTAWVLRYNGGIPWWTPNDPPVSVLPAIVKYLWQPMIQMALDAGFSPSDIGLEEINEAGVGGAGEAYSISLDRSTLSVKRIPAAGPQGYIEPYVATMLYVLQSNLDTKGCRLYPITLEGQEADQDGDGIIDAQEEINCISSSNNPDWQLVFQDPRVRGVEFNRYAQYSSTPSGAASSFAYREDWEARHIHYNPLMAGKPLFLEEFGDKISNVPVGQNPAVWRQAVLIQQRKTAGLDGAGYFLAQPSNSLAAGFELFHLDQTPVGGYVGPGVSAS